MEVHLDALFLNTELTYSIGVTPVTLFFSCSEKRHSGLKGERAAGGKREDRSNIRLNISCILDCKRSKECIWPLKNNEAEVCVFSFVQVSFTWSREPNLHPTQSLSLRHPIELSWVGCIGYQHPREIQCLRKPLTVSSSHIFCQPHCPSTNPLWPFRICAVLEEKECENNLL